MIQLFKEFWCWLTTQHMNERTENYRTGEMHVICNNCGHEWTYSRDGV